MPPNRHAFALKTAHAHILRRLDRMRACAPPDSADREHQVHLGCKRIRAWLRLLRPVLGDSHYRFENMYFRNLGRPFASWRDSEVLRGLAGRTAAETGTPAADVRKILDSMNTTASPPSMDLLAEGPLISALAAARQRLGALDLSDRDDATGGLKHLYSKSRKALHKAELQTNGANLHEWRKQVKYLYYALDIYPLSHGGQDWVRRLKKLAHQLGEAHDRTVLAERVEDSPDPSGTMLSALRQAETELVDKALRKGRHLFCDGAGRFEKHIKGD